MSKQTPPNSAGLRPLETIAARILWIRGQKVMIDADLAELYGMPTRALNQLRIETILKGRFNPMFKKPGIRHGV